MNKKQLIERFIYKKIGLLVNTSETGAGKQAFAELRKGAGKRPGDLPELFGSLLLEMPEELYGKYSEPGREEWACYIALTLYATHQQGNDVKKAPMQVKDQTLGKALRLLVIALNDDSAEDRVLEKLKVLASAKDIQEIAYHLRTVIKLLHSKEIGLDFAKLAGDIYLLQFPEYASDVRLNWGRDFYRITNENSKGEE